MTNRPRLGILGGTFDPIHVGHLATARAAARALRLTEVRFVPSRIPPHRREHPTASRYHRFALVALAIADEPSWRASDVELMRDGPSYTYDTLVTFHREGLAPSQLFFIVGADAFAEIDTWSRYPAILDAAHFVVVARPGTDIHGLERRLATLRPRMTTPDGLRDAMEPRIILLEVATPDVSSTEIRRRAQTGASVLDLVPPPVGAYIEHHALYGPHKKKKEKRQKTEVT